MSEMICMFLNMLERGSGIKVDTNHLQISLVVCQTRAILLIAKHISSWHITHNSSIAGSDATPCKLIFTRTEARLPFLCLPFNKPIHSIKILVSVTQYSLQEKMHAVWFIAGLYCT